MQWLDSITEKLIARQPEGEILIESGGSPSGTYHFGHLREVVICDAIMLELQRKGREARHVYFADDLDAFRKVPKNMPADYEKYLGIPLCDIPAPDGSNKSYADFHIDSLIKACEDLHIEVEFIYSHTKYRTGFFVPAIERCAENFSQIKDILEEVSNRELPDGWTPIQVMDNGRLKNRKFVSINTEDKTLNYLDAKDETKSVQYDKGEVKMDWRLDWPGRWWLMEVAVEPFGREHASAGGSYDTGVRIMKDIYEAEAPLAVAYDSVHMTGDTKKMSASKGTALSAEEGLEVLPSEVIRYFMLRSVLNRPIYFDPVNGVVQLLDDFAALSAKKERSESEEQLCYVCTRGIEKTISRVPFSLLVASYQAALKDVDLTLSIIARTEYSEVVNEESDLIRSELRFIDTWLEKYAPESVKFALVDKVDPGEFSEKDKEFLNKLADKISSAPDDADGAWFHKAIYDYKDELDMQPKEMFSVLYKVLINKSSGPRAGWFLSILPRNWLISRLRFEV
jgi:lysyl-tRNA synthetase class 1